MRAFVFAWGEGVELWHQSKAMRGQAKRGAAFPRAAKTIGDVRKSTSNRRRVRTPFGTLTYWSYTSRDGLNLGAYFT